MKRSIGFWANGFLICGLLIWTGWFFSSPKENRQAKELEQKGNLLFQKGEPDLAVLTWYRSIALVPQRPTPYEKISAYYLLKGQWAEAQKVIENGLTRLPSCANLYFNLGLSCYLSGDYRRAKESFEKVATLDSYYPDVHYLLGLIYHKEGREDEAKKEFIREVNLNPASRGAWKKIREQ